MVYFIQSKAGPIKIGFTKAITRRLSALQQANSENLNLLGLMQGGFKVEKTLHEKFIHLRIHGEWYRPDTELLEFITQNKLSTTIMDDLSTSNRYLPKLDRIFKEIGNNIRTARLRRNIPAALLAARAGISRPTLLSIERGDPSSAFRSYASVLFVLNLETSLSKLGADDPIGRDLQDFKLPKRARRN
jgi:DNA-binding XRE family transcriptional regulator